MRLRPPALLIVEGYREYPNNRLEGLQREAHTLHSAKPQAPGEESGSSA